MWAWMDSLSLETLSRLNYWSQVATIFFTAGLVVSATLTMTSGTRITTRRDAAEADARRQREESEREFQEGLAAAKREAAELRERMQPREVQPDRHAELIRRLSAGAGTRIMVMATVGDAERMDYAVQLARALQAAGWVIVEPGVMQYMVTATGIHIAVRDATQPPPSARILSEALGGVGISAKFDSLGPNADPQAIQLIVGGK